MGKLSCLSRYNNPGERDKFYSCVSALALLIGTTLGAAGVTKCLDLEFEIEIRNNEVKMNSAKHTVIE